MGVMYGRWPCTWSSFFPTTCPNNVVCLTQGCFPGGSAPIAKWTRRQSRTVEQKYDFYFFSFSARSKVGSWCSSTVSNWSECLPLPSTWPSKANQFMRWIDCSRMHAPSAFFAWTCLRSRNDLRHFILLEICSYLQAPQRDQLMVAFFFFFFFFFYCRSHNESGPNPLPPIWKFFRLSAMCELLRWPLIAMLDVPPLLLHVDWSWSVVWVKWKGAWGTWMEKQADEHASVKVNTKIENTHFLHSIKKSLKRQKHKELNTSLNR